MGSEAPSRTGLRSTAADAFGISFLPATTMVRFAFLRIHLVVLVLAARSTASRDPEARAAPMAALAMAAVLPGLATNTVRRLSRLFSLASFRDKDVAFLAVTRLTFARRDRDFRPVEVKPPTAVSEDAGRIAFRAFAPGPLLPTTNSGLFVAPA